MPVAPEIPVAPVSPRSPVLAKVTIMSSKLLNDVKTNFPLIEQLSFYFSLLNISPKKLTLL